MKCVSSEHQRYTAQYNTIQHNTDIFWKSCIVNLEISPVYIRDRFVLCAFGRHQIVQQAKCCDKSTIYFVTFLLPLVLFRRTERKEWRIQSSASFSARSERIKARCTLFVFDWTDKWNDLNRKYWQCWCTEEDQNGALVTYIHIYIYCSYGIPLSQLAKEWTSRPILTFEQFLPIHMHFVCVVDTFIHIILCCFYATQHQQQYIYMNVCQTVYHQVMHVVRTLRTLFGFSYSASFFNAFLLEPWLTTRIMWQKNSFRSDAEKFEEEEKNEILSLLSGKYCS